MKVNISLRRSYYYRISVIMSVNVFKRVIILCLVDEAFGVDVDATYANRIKRQILL